MLSSSDQDSTIVDNSTDDHSQVGDTQCSVKCDINEDGEVEFVKICNGAQVSSGTFNDGTSCADIIAQQTNQDESSVTDEAIEQAASDAGFDLQGGAI